jgi:hypothetical protein
MKLIETSNYIKLSQNTSSPISQGLKEKGYWFVKSPMFGGEEWKNEQGELAYLVPGGELLDLETYKENYVKMFTPSTMNDVKIKNKWLQSDNSTTIKESKKLEK